MRFHFSFNLVSGTIFLLQVNMLLRILLKIIFIFVIAFLLPSVIFL